jgi:hypothetical protein
MGETYNTNGEKTNIRIYGLLVGKPGGKETTRKNKT